MRKLFIAVLMLLSVVALNLPNHAVAAAGGACQICEGACYNNAWGWPDGYYAECRNQGGSIGTCQDQAKGDYNACVSGCNFGGCSIPLID